MKGRAVYSRGDRIVNTPLNVYQDLDPILNWVSSSFYNLILIQSAARWLR